jgi:hypothetical protein
MQKVMVQALLIFVITTVAGKAVAQAKWRQVSAFTFDWNDHAHVRVALSIPSPWDDPGDFTRIIVSVPGRKDVVFTNDNGWVKYSAEATPEVKKYKNVVSSDYVLAVKASPNRTLLLLLGYGYASSPGSLDVLEVTSDGEVHRVLHRDELGLEEVRDLDNDGLSEIVGYPCLSQEWGNGLLTYDPFNVYTLSNAPGGNATLSVSLSKSYNLKHYYGWAGPKCSEDIAVVLHPPKGGKPIIVSAKEAQQLTEPNPQH